MPKGNGKGLRANWARAIDAPPPGPGEVRRTSLPDTFDGIRYEIGRMQKYVQEGRKDPVVIDTARLVASQWAKMVHEMSSREGNPVDVHNNKTIFLEGIDLWCRHHFCYVNDPTNVEVMQTIPRMVRQTKVPREVLEHIIEPYYVALEGRDPKFSRADYAPAPVYTGDCEEAVGLELAMCAALDIQPVKFRFGGNGGSLHHVWGQVFADDRWYDTDITEPTYTLGRFSEFEDYDELEVPL